MSRLALVLDLPKNLALGEGHIQRDSGNDRLPSVVVRHAFASNRAPVIHNLVFGDAVEELLIAFLF